MPSLATLLLTTLSLSLSQGRSARTIQYPEQGQGRSGLKKYSAFHLSAELLAWICPKFGSCMDSLSGSYRRSDQAQILNLCEIDPPSPTLCWRFSADSGRKFPATAPLIRRKGPHRNPPSLKVGEHSELRLLLLNTTSPLSPNKTNSSVKLQCRTPFLVSTLCSWCCSRGGADSERGDLHAGLFRHCEEEHGTWMERPCHFTAPHVILAFSLCFASSFFHSD